MNVYATLAVFLHVKHVIWLLLLLGIFATLIIPKDPYRFSVRILYYIWWIALSEVLGAVYVHIVGNNVGFYNLVTRFNFILGLILTASLVNNRVLVRGMIAFIIVLVGTTLWDAVSINDYWSFWSFSYVVGCVLMILASYLALRINLMSEFLPQPLVIFFLFSQLLFYALTATIISSIPIALRISNDFALAIYRVNQYSLAIWCVLILTGFLLQYPRQWKTKALD